VTIRITGSLALVTGAGSGIGRATAWELARRGARVLCVDLDGEAAERFAARIGGSAYQVDVSDAAAVAALAERVHAEHGPLDLLVNNAGVGLSGRFLATTLEDWQWILGVNLMGVVHACRSFGPAMVERGRGHVVNVASGLSYTTRATEPAYVASKAAVLALSRCLRADWRDHGVSVTAVCPGVTRTAIVRHARFRGDRAGAAPRADRFFQRYGLPPSRVARAIVDSARDGAPVLMVGVETWLGWIAAKLLPTRVADRIGGIRTLP
jgi:2-hydroxycyclohexanecarboxyl-CoA dehydrogenase